MSLLDELYKATETFRKVGLSLDANTERQIEELEEKMIKEEILPALSEDIAPRLKPIKRDLVLVVEYHPGEPISVALSRKAKISEIMGAKTLTPKNSTPVKSVEEPKAIEPHDPKKHIENNTKGMRVTFPDGTVIWHVKAIDTFIETLRKIGLERVHKVGIYHGGGLYNLVGKEKRPPKPNAIWQHKVDGWLIYSNIPNTMKVQDLRQISDYYHLGLKIEEGKPK